MSQVPADRFLGCVVQLPGFWTGRVIRRSPAPNHFLVVACTDGYERSVPDDRVMICSSGTICDLPDACAHIWEEIRLSADPQDADDYVLRCTLCNAEGVEFVEFPASLNEGH
jgi:hypothetical protein